MSEELVQQDKSEVHEIVLMIPVRHVESVNKLDMCGWKYVQVKGQNGRMQRKKVSMMVLTPEARMAMANYSEVLEHCIPRDKVPKLDYSNMEITYGFYLDAKTFKRRDTDNMLKIFQDCLARHFGFNDNRGVTIHSYRRCLRRETRLSDNEYIYVKMKNNSRADNELIVDESDIVKNVGMSIT